MLAVYVSAGPLQKLSLAEDAEGGQRSQQLLLPAFPLSRKGQDETGSSRTSSPGV